MAANFETVCLGCIFLEKDDNNNSIVQNGCMLNVLDKLQNKKEDISYVTDDDGNKFNIIKNRVCQFYRNKKWLKNNSPSHDDLEKAMVLAKKEAEVKVDILLYVEENNTVEQVRSTIQRVCCENILPNQVIIINNDCKIKLPLLINSAIDCKAKWRIENIIEKQCTRDRAIDIASKKCTGMFIEILDAGNEANIIDKIENAINIDMRKILCIDNVCVHRVLFNELKQNNEKNIFDKIKDIEEIKNMVIDMETL